MKPKKLILCGWGPYKEKQEIDFTALEKRGLFLITGATGAGKTTVFDAITYALYGAMSGNVREKGSVRSDFADPATPTYVELFMEHGGKSYHIRRNPEYLRRRKRRSGKEGEEKKTEGMARERENAVLTLPDGKKLEGSTLVTGKIKELLSLDERQFKQLSMIAQGEFARFLTASPAEKSRIFRELFDTELYERVTCALHRKSADLYKRGAEYRHKMEEDAALFVPGKELAEGWRRLTEGEGLYYEGILQFLEQGLSFYEKRREETKGRLEEAEAKIRLLTAKEAEGERISRLFLKLREEESRYQELLSHKKEQEGNLEILQRSLAAGQVRLWEEKKKTAAELKRRSLEKQALLLKEIRQLRQKEEGERLLYSSEDRIREAYERRRSLKEKEAELAGDKERLSDLQKALDRKKESYLLSRQQEEESRALFEEAELCYRRGIAGVLALSLSDGSPCPVCGSPTHPARAVLEKDAPSQGQVEEKKALYEEKREKRIRLSEEAVACKELSEQLFRQTKEKEAALFLKRRQEAEEAEWIRSYVGSHEEKEFLTGKKAYEALLGVLEEKEKLKQELERELSEFSEQERALGEAFERKLKESGFACEQAYQAAFLSEEEESLLQRKTRQYQEELHAGERMQNHLREELSGKQAFDVSKVREELLLKRQKREALLQEQTENIHQEKDIRRLLASLREKSEKLEALSKEYGLIKDLDDAAAGNNRLRLQFEQYVLAAYFEEILKAANGRLSLLSGGRYRLKRVELPEDGRSKDSLEMEVMDYYTGKYRSVKTLSGGETFKVSLSLALGMSDVVQAYSGGIRVEALFVDEGFGTLDSESLEQACLTLQSLAEKDRMIGIISHVPELSEKIRGQIVVTKTNTGSRAEVVVF